jgi:ADP-ribose pyrophosphatase YjhB (NUDIX family)
MSMNRLIARVWHLMRGSVQWRVLWLAHSKFMIGVTGIVRDRDGQVLLLRHRLWPEDRQWGLPTGYAKAGESFPDTVAREVREETGLTVTVGDLAHLRITDPPHSPASSRLRHSADQKTPPLSDDRTDAAQRQPQRGGCGHGGGVRSLSLSGQACPLWA